jgi:WD40 repeat protein
MPSFSLFLSYNSADRSFVIAVQRLLEARSITTFLDRDQLSPGLPWPVALEEGLRNVRGVAVFIGRDLGGWQKREMWFALDRQVREEKERRLFPVIPVLLPGADLTACFLFLNTWIDLRSGLDGTVTAESLDAFESAIKATEPAAATERVSTVRPYRGLEAFREEDAAFFAGRTAFARQLFDFTLGRDLVAVVGPSGSGKSSVVQAGLIPLLRREHPPSTTWDSVTFTPGAAPFQRLAFALTPLLEPDLNETDRLREAQKLGDGLLAGEVKLELVIDRVIDKSNGTGRLLLIADQFEELFTLTPEPNRRLFATALVSAIGRARFTLLITLRADFYSQIITLDRDLSDRLAPAQVNVGALTNEELRESIVAPAKLVGLEFEPGVVDRILRDVGNEPGNLPLLEFALTGLWSNRQGRMLTNAAYDEIGGVTGALAQRAEAEFSKFTAEEQGAVRRLFSRLVRVATPEEGSEDTRQRIELRVSESLSEKVARALAGPEVRLLVMSGETERQIVEVAHEALIRNWERLRLWLNEDREFLLWRQRTQILVAQWLQHGRDTDDLLRGATLSEAERWLATHSQDIQDGQAEYVRESSALRQRELKAEQERNETELRIAIQRAKVAAQFAKRFRRFSLALGVLLLFALGTAGYAFWEQTTARARELVATSISAQADDPELAILIAAKAVTATWPLGHAALPEAEQQLHNAIFVSLVRLLTLSGPVYSVAWSPDGKRLATGSEDKTAKVWDAATGKELLTLSGHSAPVNSIAWSPDGKRLATGSDDKTAKVWDAATCKELLTLSGHRGKVLSVGWSPDDKRLATASYDATAKVWDVATGKELLTLSGHSGMVLSVAWSPDGKRLATASYDKTAKVWDAATGKELLTLSGHRDIVLRAAWSPNGKRLATGNADTTAKVWDAATGKELLTLSGPSSYVFSVAWSPDGKRLATASDDKTKVWDAATGKELLTLSGSEMVFSVAWSPDGKQLAVASRDGVVQVYAMDIHDLMDLARERVTTHPSSENCQKYLHSACPPFPKLVWW